MTRNNQNEKNDIKKEQKNGIAKNHETWLSMFSFSKMLTNIDQQPFRNSMLLREIFILHND